MKKFLMAISMVALVAGSLAACDRDKQPQTSPTQQEQGQPQHQNSGSDQNSDNSSY